MPPPLPPPRPRWHLFVAVLAAVVVLGWCGREDPDAAEEQAAVAARADSVEDSRAAEFWTENARRDAAAAQRDSIAAAMGPQPVPDAEADAAYALRHGPPPPRRAIVPDVVREYVNARRVARERVRFEACAGPTAAPKGYRYACSFTAMNRMGVEVRGVGEFFVSQGAVVDARIEE